MGGKWIHRRISIDIENGIFNCANCGPTPIKWQFAHGKPTAYCALGTRGGVIHRGIHTPEDRCVLCGSDHLVCFDHCHETNMNRDLLCHGCNVAIGFFKDDPELMRRAATYVEEWRQRHQEN